MPFYYELRPNIMKQTSITHIFLVYHDSLLGGFIALFEKIAHVGKYNPLTQYRKQTVPLDEYFRVKVSWVDVKEYVQIIFVTLLNC